MSDKMREEFEEWYKSQAVFHKAHLVPLPNGCYSGFVAETAWRAWQAARTVPALHAEQIRVAAVAAIREVTGCPDIKGNDGAYLVDALIVNLLSAAPEGKK